jgi:hypothetical protein
MINLPWGLFDSYWQIASLFMGGLLCYLMGMLAKEVEIQSLNHHLTMSYEVVHWHSTYAALIGVA